MELKKWYSRKAKYGTSTTAHAVLHDAERDVFFLLCRQRGAYRPDTLVFVENAVPKNQCIECVAKITAGAGVKP